MREKIPIITTNYEASIFPLILLAEVIFQDFSQITPGYKWASFSLGIWQFRTNKWAVNEKPSRKLAYFLIRKFEKDKRFFSKTKENIFKYSHALINFSQKFFKEDLRKKKDIVLWRYYQEYVRRYKKMYLWGWLPNALEGEGDIFTLKLEKFLMKKLKEIGKQNKIGDYFATLTTLTSLKSEREKEKEALLKIALKIKRRPKTFRLFKRNFKDILNKLSIIDPEIDTLLEKHTYKYCWLTFNYEGPPLRKRDFILKIKKLLKQDPQKKLKNLKKEKENLLKKQKEYIKELKLDKDSKWYFLFKLARWMFFLKDWRKNVLYQSYYHLDFLIKEIGRRLKLSPMEVRHILPSEMKEALTRKKYSPAVLKERIKFSVIVFRGKDYKLYIGSKAKEIVKKYVKLTEKIQKTKLISGQVAYPGKTKGRVKIILDSQDNAKMKKGNILVSEKTDPSLMSAILKAKAIITDEGGITCHAAIISRELKIPCIIGTKIATKVLKDGDLVEVDADKGVVRIINRVKNDYRKN